jgi:hypothetical protein
VVAAPSNAAATPHACLCLARAEELDDRTPLFRVVEALRHPRAPDHRARVCQERIQRFRRPGHSRCLEGGRILEALITSGRPSDDPLQMGPNAVASGGDLMACAAALLEQPRSGAASVSWE